MAQVVKLSQYREQTAVRRGYAQWRKRFKDDFSRDTRVMDLKDATLLSLARPGEDTTALLHTLILGFSGYPQNALFEALEPQVQMRLLDIYFFLSDQLHFEMMFRLDWVSSFAGRTLPLYQMVTAYSKAVEACRQNPPLLCSKHRDYGTFKKLIEREKQVFVRRLLPKALEAFEKRCGES